MYGFTPGSLSFDMSKFNNDNSRRTQTNGTRGNNNQRQKKSNQSGNRLGKMSLESFSRYMNGTPMGSTPKQDTRKDKVSQNSNKAIVDQATLDDFVEEYTKNKTDSAVISSLLRTQIVEVGKIMEHYYEKTYAEVAESMTNIIKLMTTKTFAMNLIAVVKNYEEVFNDWEEDKKHIAYLISLALETHHNKMIDETKSIYVEIITEYIWSFDIKDISTRFHLSEDAAADLVIGIPCFGRDMTETQIRHQYSNFLNMLINHGASAINYLTTENQMTLFYYLFKDENKIAVKAVGQCLGDERIEFEQPEDQALYTEYVNMLYSILNEHDLDEIRVVLRYIVKVRANLRDQNKDTITVFDINKAIEYSNIKKAIVDYCEHSEAAKEFLS